MKAEAKLQLLLLELFCNNKHLSLNEKIVNNLRKIVKFHIKLKRKMFRCKKTGITLNTY